MIFLKYTGALRENNYSINNKRYQTYNISIDFLVNKGFKLVSCHVLEHCRKYTINQLKNIFLCVGLRASTGLPPLYSNEAKLTQSVATDNRESCQMWPTLWPLSGNSLWRVGVGGTLPPWMKRSPSNSWCQSQFKVAIARRACIATDHRNHPGPTQ